MHVNHKRVLILALALVMVFTLALPVAAASEDAKTAVLKIDSPYCALDGQVTTIDPANQNVVPTLISDRTMLPIRILIEHFGGEVAWDGAARQATCTLGDRTVVLTVDSTTALVNDEETALDVPATIRDDRTLVPVRFVSESLLLNVAWEPQNRLAIISDQALPEDTAQLLEMEGVRALLDEISAPETDPEPAASPVTLTQQSYQLPSGTVSANVVTVDLSDPSVRVEARHVDSTLDHTAPFSSIVAGSDAEVIVNANFFNSYDEIQDPIGTLMVDGQFLYCNSGLPSIGFTADNQVFWGNPSVFVAIDDTEGNSWSAYTVNTLEQSYDVSVLYTPARGSSVPITVDGYAMTISGGKISSYGPVYAGTEAAIPANGSLVFMGPGFVSTNYFRTPTVGNAVTLTPYQRVTDSEGFVLDEVTQIISGAPRLVKDGAISTELIPGFEEDRFTTASTPRTAIGTTADGKLILVNVSSATVQQMRELMLNLGCQDATNLDGGASTAMYVQGNTLCSPGRELTSTLHIFVD